jgi:hypothetical protein
MLIYPGNRSRYKSRYRRGYVSMCQSSKNFNNETT